MSKKDRSSGGGGTAVEERGEETPQAQMEATTEAIATEIGEEKPSEEPQLEGNYTMFRHNNGGHPDGRASYTIPGVKGNMVIFPTLFFELEDGNFPETLELFTRVDGKLCPVRLAESKEKVTATAKQEAAAKKAQEKAEKELEKLTAAQAKLVEANKKRDELLAAARAKIAAAQSGSVAT